MKLALLLLSILSLAGCQNSTTAQKSNAVVRVSSTEGEALFKVKGERNLNYKSVYGLWEGILSEDKDSKTTARFLFQRDKATISTKCQIKRDRQIVDTLFTSVDVDAEIFNSKIRFYENIKDRSQSSEGHCEIDIKAQETEYSFLISNELCFGGKYPNCFVMFKLRDQ